MPRVCVAKRVRQRIAVVNPVNHIPGQIPHALFAGRLGDGQLDVRGVANVIPRARIHHQLYQVARLNRELALRFERLPLAVVVLPARHRVGAAARDDLHAPRRAIAAHAVRIGHKPVEPNLPVHRATPKQHRLLVRRGMHGHGACGYHERAEADDVVGLVGGKAGRVRNSPTAVSRISAQI